MVEWNEFRCKQLSHFYSTLWGKENEMTKIALLFWSFLSFSLVLMLSHVTATINPLGYFVITILFVLLFCRNALNSSRRGPIQTGKASYTKRNSGWDSSRSFCMLKGFDKALRVSLPHIGIETSIFGNENHMVESDRASVFDLIGVLV